MSEDAREGRTRVVVADDEPLARERLRMLLGSEPWLELVAECQNGIEAIDAIQGLSPDLVFLDVQMPGATGFEVIEAVGAENMPPVVFVTAYDQYALRAFDVRALDYLLKPFGPERFKEAVERARQAVRVKEDEATDERLREALAAQGPLSRIFVRSRGRVVPVAVADICRIDRLCHLVERPGRFTRPEELQLTNAIGVAMLLSGRTQRVVEALVSAWGRS